MTKRSREKITSGIVVVHTPEECNQFAVVFVTVHSDLSLFLGAVTGTEIVCSETIVGEIIIGRGESGILPILV